MPWRRLGKGRTPEQAEWNRKLKLKAWLLFRLDFLVRQPACQHHLKQGLVRIATDVHHLRRRENPWDAPDDELLALCHPCHAKLTRGGG